MDVETDATVPERVTPWEQRDRLGREVSTSDQAITIANAEHRVATHPAGSVHLGRPAGA